jgi:hypothetical protein
MKRTLVLAFAFLPSMGCQTTPGDAPATGGSGGSGGTTPSAGGSGSGGVPEGGFNNPDGTLNTLECVEGRQQWPVGGAACSLSSDQVGMQVYRENDAVRLLLGVGTGGLAPGIRFTEYGGSMMQWQAEQGENYVQFSPAVCYGAASFYTPDPCEIELVALDRGEVEAGGSGGAAIERGSRVRMRIACPSGLYSPGGDDYGPSLREIIPSEFELEARDCILVED